MGRHLKCPPPPRNSFYLPDLLAELGRINEKESVFLGQERGGNGHRVEQNIASSDVEKPRYLHTTKHRATCVKGVI